MGAPVQLARLLNTVERLLHRLGHLLLHRKVRAQVGQESLVDHAIFLFTRLVNFGDCRFNRFCEFGTKKLVFPGLCLEWSLRNV